MFVKFDIFKKDTKDVTEISIRLSSIVSVYELSEGECVVETEVGTLISPEPYDVLLYKLGSTERVSTEVKEFKVYHD